MTISLAGFSAFSLVLSIVFYWLGGGTVGMLGFYAWKLFSTEAHGGQYASINGIQLYYETYGSGQPVLILHGGTGSLEDMRYQIAALASDRFVVAPDSRGHGRSSDTDAPFSYALMADDMLTLLDQLKLDRVDVVGWSDGGIIGLDLAIHRPERVRRLVVIGGNYDANGLTHPPVVAGELPPPSWLYSHFALNPDHWPVFYRKVITMWQTQPHYSLDQLGSIKAPTLIVAGEFDVITREHTDQLAKAIPAAQEIIITGATHFVIVDQPHVIDALISRFLDGRNLE
jgi:pimeloyl-ACP methyl ester carboxylesterase